MAPKIVLTDSYKKRVYPLRYHEQQQLIFEDTYTKRHRFNVVPAGRRCLAVGSLIHLCDGSVKPIEKIKIGDMVWSVNGDNKLEPNKVSFVFDNGIQDCLQISTNKRSIECTENHPFKVNNKLTHANKIKIDDLVAVYTSLVFGSNGSHEEIKNIKPVGKKQTYNLTVEGNHNYIANGFFSKNSGKTECVGKRRFVARAVAGVPAPNPRFFVAAPTRDQVQKIYWSDLKLLTRPFQDPHRPPMESRLIIYLRGDIEIHLIGLDKPERVEGSHWDGCVVDEIANCKPKAWPEHIRPALSTPGRPPAWCDFIGVPEGRNFYYDMFKYAQAEFLEKGIDSDWRSYHWKSSDILPASEIAAARRELDPITFDQEYSGSFVNFSGRCYYNFDERIHCAKLHYDPTKPLIFCFDFNISPGVAAVCQEQYYVDPKTNIMQLDKRVTGIIGEVHVPTNSTTVIVCNRLVLDWGDHQGEIHVYGDATGGGGGSAKIMGSDWDLVKGVLNAHFGERVSYFVGKENPRERERVNAVNSHFLSIDNIVRAQIDPSRCPMLVRDFEGVSLLPGGSGEIDKKINLKITHLCFGKGTVVQTDKGVMNIEDLPETGKIKTYDGSYANFKNTGSRGFKKTIKLVFNNGRSVVCTEDHMFLTELGWKKAIDLLGIVLIEGASITADTKNPLDFLCNGEKYREELAESIQSNSYKASIMRVDAIMDSGVQEVFCPTVETGCFLLFDQIVVSNSDAYGYYVAKEFPTRVSYDQSQRISGF